VMVGKRVEARAHVDHAGTSAARDPLAALDALDASSRGAALRAPGPGSGRAVADLEAAIAVGDAAEALKSVRLKLGEGIEKRSSDLAAEVAAALSGQA